MPGQACVWRVHSTRQSPSDSFAQVTWTTWHLACSLHPEVLPLHANDVRVIQVWAPAELPPPAWRIERRFRSRPLHRAFSLFHGVK